MQSPYMISHCLILSLSSLKNEKTLSKCTYFSFEYSYKSRMSNVQKYTDNQ